MGKFCIFWCELGEQDKPWAPHNVCCTSVEELYSRFKGKQDAFQYGIPMVWKKPQNHSDDCYFCSCNVQSYNVKDSEAILYPTICSVICPVAHSPGISVPKRSANLEDLHENENKDTVDDDIYKSGSCEPQDFSQTELTDLVRDFSLTKETTELLGSRFTEKKLLAPGTSFYWHMNKEEVFIPIFTAHGDLVYCCNVHGLMNSYNIDYKEEWRLFIDSSKRTLKPVLLNNSNKYASLPMAHSIHLNKCYENITSNLSQLNYNGHSWIICGDLKVLSMLLGQQSGYTKYPCFLCEWDSRDKGQHWIKKEWISRNSLQPGIKNIVRMSLV